MGRKDFKGLDAKGNGSDKPRKHSGDRPERNLVNTEGEEIILDETPEERKARQDRMMEELKRQGRIPKDAVLLGEGFHRYFVEIRTDEEEEAKADGE